MSDSVGFWKRLFAGVLDGIIVSAPLAIIFGVITGEWENENFSTLFNFPLHGDCPDTMVWLYSW